MLELPAAMATLPRRRAWVKVGPPLFCRGPRLSCALVTLCAQALVALDEAWVTMLFAEIVGLLMLPEGIRVTVPPPA